MIEFIQARSQDIMVLSSAASHSVGNFYEITDRLMAGLVVSKDDLKVLLAPADPGELAHLFHVARKIRERYFGNSVFLYGFLYFSTHCRNDCRFCQYRVTNTAMERYRKDRSEILAAAEEMAKDGVHLIDLTSGEDPKLLDEKGFRFLGEIISMIRRSTDLPVMLSPGVLDRAQMESVASEGADWYACYQETHDRALFGRLRHGQNYDQRLGSKWAARAQGLLIEEGILLGVGESLEQVADSICWMRQNDIDQVRAMTYVPSPECSLPLRLPVVSEEVAIAVMRLVMPQSLIPASLDVEGLAGLGRRLAAGANVITSIVPPDRGLVGVARPTLDIKDQRRTAKNILPVVRACDMMPATAEKYREWLQARKDHHKKHTSGMEIIP